MYVITAHLHVCVNKLNVTLRLHLIINYQKRHGSALSISLYKSGVYTKSSNILLTC